VFIPLLFHPWCPGFGVPSLLLISSLLLLVFPMFLLVPAVFGVPTVVFLLLLASLLLLVYTVGDSVIAVAVLLLYEKYLRQSDYRTTTIGQVIFSAIGL
jgi:hypothetical protein